MAADKEIGLLQIRTGKQRDLPISLEFGEMSFSTDECRMFIGHPVAITPASLVAGRSAEIGTGRENVEILTEFTPAHIMNKALYKPNKIFVQGTSESNIVVPNMSKVFVDYVAEFVDTVDSSNTWVETGVVTVVQSNTGIISQIGNTNHSSGDTKLKAISISMTGGLLKIAMKNEDAVSCSIEYIYRGW